MSFLSPWKLPKHSPSWWLFARGPSIWMIICERPVHPDYHLQEVRPSGWSFVRASLSGWAFARGLSIQMIICKMPVHQDDLCKRWIHQDLQVTGPSGWSFARGRSNRLIISKLPVQQDDHLNWSLLFVIGHYLSFVVFCCWSLFVVGRCLSLVIVFVVVCRLLLFVICHHLLFVIVCRFSMFVIWRCLLFLLKKCSKTGTAKYLFCLKSCLERMRYQRIFSVM